jgi:uncharacterized membrane protein
MKMFGSRRSSYRLVPAFIFFCHETVALLYHSVGVTYFMMMKPYQLGLVAYLLLCCIIVVCTNAAYDEMVDVDEQEPHPDPNDENYVGMIYIGRMDDDGKRVGWHTDNGRM